MITNEDPRATAYAIAKAAADEARDVLPDSVSIVPTVHHANSMPALVVAWRAVVPVTDDSMAIMQQLAAATTLAGHFANGSMISLVDAAQRVGQPYQRVYRWATRGDIIAAKIDRCWFVNVASLESKALRTRNGRPSIAAE